MNYKVYLFIISTLVMALAVQASWSKELDVKAHELGNAKNISTWVEVNINYVYYFKPQGVRHTWITREGDCTDKSQLKCRMMHDIGILCRTVHGYVYEDESDYGKIDVKFMHDWIEWNENGTWTTDEYSAWSRVDKIGHGVW